MLFHFVLSVFFATSIIVNWISSSILDEGQESLLRLLDEVKSYRSLPCGVGEPAKQHINNYFFALNLNVLKWNWVVECPSLRSVATKAFYQAQVAFVACRLDVIFAGIFVAGMRECWTKRLWSRWYRKFEPLISRFAQAKDTPSFIAFSLVHLAIGVLVSYYSAQISVFLRAWWIWILVVITGILNAGCVFEVTRGTADNDRNDWDCFATLLKLFYSVFEAVNGYKIIIDWILPVTKEYFIVTTMRGVITLLLFQFVVGYLSGLCVDPGNSLPSKLKLVFDRVRDMCVPGVVLPLKWHEMSPDAMGKEMLRLLVCMCFKGDNFVYKYGKECGAEARGVVFVE